MPQVCQVYKSLENGRDELVDQLLSSKVMLKCRTCNNIFKIFSGAFLFEVVDGLPEEGDPAQ